MAESEVVAKVIDKSWSFAANVLLLDDIYKELKHEGERLQALQQDKQDEVKRNSQKHKTASYGLWDNKASDLLQKVDDLEKTYKQVTENKLLFFKRPGLVEKMKKALNGIEKHLEECEENILVDKLQRVKRYGVSSIEKYPILVKAFKEIQDELRKVNCVALHGQKGVGKSTIMKTLNNFYDSNDRSFEVVIFIEVPTDEQTDLQILQKIARRIEEDEEGNESEVAGRIQKMLENKKYLLILDGVRHPIDEIWNYLDISKDKKGSKVVIATQYPLAYKSNCVNKKLEVERLSPAEAWTMFKEIAGTNIDIPIAHNMCRTFCCRLPLLISRTAKSMKYLEAPPDWKQALNKFRYWPEVRVDGLDELYAHLEICYRQLDDISKQRCFLYASLYPANSKIVSDYLMESCIAQDFLRDVDAGAPYNEKRRGVEVILRHLVNVSFLEEEEQMRYVKMNDCNRHLALFISSKDSECGSYVDKEEHKKQCRSESCQHPKWASWVGIKKDNLPNCGKIQTLLPQNNLELVEIPPAYFDSMCNLLVLNLHGTRIRRLPSLSGLTGLKVFYLNGCLDLTMSQSEIQPLQQLEVFDIRDTKINFVPCLKSLRCLRISCPASNDQNGDQSDYHKISELRKLEELIIEVKSLDQWCDHAGYIVEEVASLEHLTTFRCSFPSLETLGNFMKIREPRRGQEKLTSFQFFVGCENSKQPKIIELFDCRISKYVKYCNGDQKNDLAMTKILPQAETFELICHRKVENILELVDNTSSLKHLRGLLIERCNQISAVVAGNMVCNAIDGNSTENAGLLPKLEQLHLDNLLRLKWAFRGHLPNGSFSMLHTLTLNNCPKLESIFFKVAFEDFPELQKLVVQNCSKIEVLIRVKDVIGREQSILPKLKVVILDNLSNLKFICPEKNLAWRDLEQLNVHKCPELKSLPFNTSNASKLGTIEGENEWWSNLKWSGEVRQRFESAFSAST